MHEGDTTHIKPVTINLLLCLLSQSTDIRIRLHIARTHPCGWLDFSLGHGPKSRGRASRRIRQMACHHSAIHMHHVAEVFLNAERKHHDIQDDNGR